MTPPRSAGELRRAWHDFWHQRGHVEVPSASVIPVDRTVLFTVAGMVPFKPYFVGEERAPYGRASSIQKCVRAGGKHNDLDDIGRTNRHFSFFEMMGNFSFGDYFKTEAITWAWEWVTETLGFDPDRLWVTVHESDDEAEQIWADGVGFPMARIQRLGEDNFWKMGDTGPCGPCSEIFFDLGPEHGPDGGPRTDSGRYIEFWNLVFMQYDQQPDGTKVPLPEPSIDTGAGLERNLALLQGRDSIWDIDVFQPLIEVAQSVTGVAYGRDPEHDVYLRILAEHARTMTFIVSDGVTPSNQERGYVLRRIIRRAVRHAYLLGARQLVTPALVSAVCDVMGDAYPKIVADRDLVAGIVSREEEAFRSTLARGTEYLDDIVGKGDVAGSDAFFLHDTLGFPVDLTREIAAEHGRRVDVDEYDQLMAAQRQRARDAAKEAGIAATVPVELYREIVDDRGPTVFTGRDEYTTQGARILALVRDGERVARAEAGEQVDVVLDRTPFYAESGGQVGDTGTLRTAAAEVAVRDTQYGLPDLVVHRAEVLDGSLAEGDTVEAGIDGPRRDAIRRNHTATHLLHHMLRTVLGEHVQQAGSHVGPERLRFDFSHFQSVSPEELHAIEDGANALVLSDLDVAHDEMAKAEAEALGAVAFFGDKYGERVRVLTAGPSREFCGGTHVDALGFIGPIVVVSEGSIGSNVRRIEALTGEGALRHFRDEHERLSRLGERLKAAPHELEDRVAKLQEQVKGLQDDVKAMREAGARAAAKELAANAPGGTLVALRDGAQPDELRLLAQLTVQEMGSGIVALVGRNPDGNKAALAVAVSKDLVAAGSSAADLATPAARALGGGTNKHAELVVGGGPKVDGVDEALRLLAEAIPPR